MRVKYLFLFIWEKIKRADKYINSKYRIAYWFIRTPIVLAACLVMFVLCVIIMLLNAIFNPKFFWLTIKSLKK